MHDRSHLIEERIDRFIVERLEPACYRARVPLVVDAWQVPGEPVPFTVAAAADYSPFSVGMPWGRAWSTTWFRVRGEVPPEWRDSSAGECHPEVIIDLGCDRRQPGFQAEALLWRPDGTIVKAISPYNNAAAGAVAPDGTVDVFVEAAANPDVGSDWSFRPTAMGDPATAGDDPQYVLRQVDLGLFDLPVWELLADVRVLRGLLGQLPMGTRRRADILTALERVTDLVDPDDVSGSAACARASLTAVLSQPAHASAHELRAVGHAHIDSAWLWPVRETIRKCARTFSNVIALMEENPDFVFACSSAQQFAWIKEYYPELFERIRVKVAAGQFVPVGGMWVESDTNMPGGEAMARQFIAGQSFFLDEFGIECQEVWLPDSFGYSGALPQIARAAGARWFLTQKISWNETNVMPHHTFLWEGIDGTRIFTHFPPVDKYNSDLSAADLAHADSTFADHGRSGLSLLPFGYGDGGGGPTRDMLAVVSRTSSLEGSPKVVHSTPRAFFSATESAYPAPEVWSGELYLESHRGVYTSQLRTKQGNRRSEHLLREAELWSATAAVREGAAYPAADLRDLWQLVLLQQFHDILPGSSIAWVHQDAERNYAAIARRAEALIDLALRRLAGTGTSSLVVNATPHERGGVPALGGGARAAVPLDSEARAETGGIVLENQRVRVMIDADGLISELRDLASGRDLVPPGRRGNLFQLHRDTPNKWDAWDIDWHYRHSVTDLVEADLVRVGDDGASVRIERSFSRSTIVQTISLDDAVVHFDLTIDWHERQKLLKLAFPLDVHADRFASEIQFGHIERPTHTNTSWDAARYETSAHRWIRVAEPDFGVAIVNDSTYGYDVTREPKDAGGSATLARLSILRSALFPDPQQDQGVHRLRVGLVLGATTQEAVIEGYRINLPERILRNTAKEVVAPLVTVSNPGVVVEALKLAEDGSGDVIVRLYEALGRRELVSITPGFAVSSAARTDLLERVMPQEPCAITRGAVTLELRPFQLVTLRLRR
ncbi:alpha-mannosidase [Rathayibacter toxicus]|uniref:Alpha-mannosidase n=1 Tax=Rathayibacter toxicus TaxID=145458 RepID=A0A2S5Y6F4_9MICO|nr:glycoside hydrolase family 38 C-terminal domain-containing protein [Rathayibacter toxicus]PPH22708.1 alpha-mannosidase [Rathayibacter toxicus]PPH56912.1 alpha-mannosidase [Rathayibacter toxicus]PPH59602.1 alpha-mannosidase [Rathayibacter toxicus]PPH86832.1 alpha-mannosidase [Rathayibacter toxicus]PPI14553.1 alpha-mannosidase [Rathayibacter toxicus]